MVELRSPLPGDSVLLAYDVAALARVVLQIVKLLDGSRRAHRFGNPRRRIHIDQGMWLSTDELPTCAAQRTHYVSNLGAFFIIGVGRMSCAVHRRPIGLQVNRLRTG